MHLKTSIQALLVGCEGKGEEAAWGGRSGRRGRHNMNHGKPNEERQTLATFSRSRCN